MYDLSKNNENIQYLLLTSQWLLNPNEELKYWLSENIVFRYLLAAVSSDNVYRNTKPNLLNILITVFSGPIAVATMLKIPQCKEICTIYEDGATSVHIVHSWFRRFRSANFNLKDEEHSNRVHYGYGIDLDHVTTVIENLRLSTWGHQRGDDELSSETAVDYFSCCCEITEIISSHYVRTFIWKDKSADFLYMDEESKQDL
ncbi:hypothetical protein HZH68_016159 [Vespula germanica]|uniref:Mos1 transposase HTH domain-containing protein n=1 Tax=Vespula germanica TaxID=30212 RepID=A0A834J6E6_VESGE|nr:hypothetical protein HZH68_016159 [Vespula germanica]